MTTEPIGELVPAYDAVKVAAMAFKDTEDASMQAQVMELLPAAAKFITDKLGVAWWKAAEMRFVAESANRVIFPLSPVVAVSSVKETGIEGQAIAGWTAPGSPPRMIRLAKATPVVIEAIVGWKGSAPHLLEMALAYLCREWVLEPSMVGESAGTAWPKIHQAVAIYQPLVGRGW